MTDTVLLAAAFEMRMPDMDVPFGGRIPRGYEEGHVTLRYYDVRHERVNLIKVRADRNGPSLAELHVMRPTGDDVRYAEALLTTLVPAVNVEGNAVEPASSTKAKAVTRVIHNEVKDVLATVGMGEAIAGVETIKQRVIEALETRYPNSPLGNIAVHIQHDESLLVQASLVFDVSEIKVGFAL